jgi:hypothetical protein
MTASGGYPKRLVIFILSVASLGMLLHGMAWISTLIYQLPWMDFLRAFPLTTEALDAFIAKARFYTFVQMLFHGILFIGAYLLLRNKPKGKWVVFSGGAMTILTTIFLPMIFPAVDPATVEAAGKEVYGDFRSNLTIVGILWAVLWVAVLYYLQSRSR